MPEPVVVQPGRVGEEVEVASGVQEYHGVVVME